MDLFHLTRKVEVGHDEAKGFVIQATDEIMARLLAASKCGDEGQDVWALPLESICEKIGTAKPAKRGEKLANRIVMRSFKNG